MTDASLLSRRILALHLPRLATDRLHRRAAGASWLSNAARADAAPLAVFARLGAAFRLEAVDAAAAARGLAPGQPLADARARVPDLVLVERDPDGERETLEAIADWCDRFTPLVGLDDDFDGEAGLLLDIAGVAHLFGGEAAMAAGVVDDLAARGFTARVAVADTCGAARAVVRHGLGTAATRIVAAGDGAAALAPLPVAAVDPTPGRAAALARLGLDTIGALRALPRAALARRFGRELLDRLDEAEGLADRPVSPRRPVAALAAERRLMEPLVSRADVALVARSLAEGLAASLERRGEGVRLAELALWRVDGTVQRTRVGTGRALRDPDLLLALFAERLKGEENVIEVGFGIDLVRLSILATSRDDPAQIDLGGDARARADFERLVDRLGARLGTRRVLVHGPGDGHLPEAAAVAHVAASDGARAAANAWCFEPAPDARPAPGRAVAARADEPPVRPLRLLARPEPIDTLADLADGPPLRFRWRRVFHEVARAEGPERIAAEWWRLPFGLGPERTLASAATAGEGTTEGVEADDLDAAGDDDALPPFDPTAATRDYFRVEDTTGRRFWIFRAGLFARETLRPRWFLHGLFA